MKQPFHFLPGISLIFLLGVAQAVLAQPLNSPKPVVKIIVARPLGSAPIKLDGRLTEKIWRSIPPTDHFVQQDPLENALPSEKTLVRVTYNRHFLYVGIRALDSHPEQIVGQLTRRDENSSSDWLAVLIDSYHDFQTAFYFGLNAAGVRQDKLITNDGDTEDLNWNPVWKGAVSRDEKGWSAEFQIPFSQIRFSSRDKPVWGFQVCRKIQRLNEIDYWAPEPKDAAGIVSNFGELRGLRAIPSPKKLELLPYGLISEKVTGHNSANPFSNGNTFSGNGGLDVKYGLSSNLTLNATVNPDFGQVEADPSELNLTAYETYFEEKRPFFVEGKNIFDENLALSGNSAYSENLFYSRRIGGAPHYRPSSVSADSISLPEQTRILGAAKITGKTAGGWSVGVLDAVTAEEKATVQEKTFRHREIVEPLTNYGVARIMRDFRNGRTSLGGIVTNVYRNIPNSTFYFLNTQATTYGLDLWHRWGRDTYAVKFSLFGSYLSGHKEALQRIQRSSAHYFQRPDAKHVHFDPNRTHLSGLASVFFVGKIAQGHWRGGVGYVTRTPGFEANDIGYMRTADFLTAFYWSGFIQYTPGPIFRNYSITHNLWTTLNYGGERKVLGANLSSHFRFLNYWEGYLRLDRYSRTLDFAALRGGPALLKPPKTLLWFGFSSDKRKTVSFTFDGSIQRSDKISWNAQWEPGIFVRPSGRLNFSFSIGYYPNLNDLQYFSGNTNAGGQTVYQLARLHQRTVALTTRINYTLTPNLSIQFYGQPYISSGWYSDFKEVVRPRAARYEARFAPLDRASLPHFHFRQFRSNLVLRWEYLPGSTLFLVWSQGRTGFSTEQNLDLNHDFAALFKDRGEQIFLLKLNYWFTP